MSSTLLFKLISRSVLLLIVTSLLGCSTLPAFGPSSEDIIAAAENKQIDSEVNFHLIDVSSSTLPRLEDFHPHQFPASLRKQEYLTSNQQVIAGDVIVIRVWEAADDGLFATAGQRETLFTLTVSNSSTIDVPYAGNINIANKSTHQIREILLERYRGKAIDPEINVEIKETSSRGVSVLGAIASPGRITIPAQGLKLLDLIALAGGIAHPEWEIEVTLTRKGVPSSLNLEYLLADSDNNIIVLPNDNLQISYLPRRFSVYGAIAKSGNISVNSPIVKLSDLLAESGGLRDMQAEASSVFIFRPSIQRELNEGESVAYRLNFSKPDAFLLASEFEMSPTDIVYIATADASEFRKFVTLLFSPLLGSVSRTNNLGN